ncbi:hypothetical protein [Atlantibacter hermannii]|uniref:hypothetical protein n=1 Tax=Atlantibacter hermannii TaxID=565 RepID=UPI0028A90271|nr:hypothetical protein [Atlantibacter hermannii]
MKNIWAWILAVSPLILFLPFDWTIILMVYGAVVIIAGYIDRKEVVKDGWMAPSMLGVIIPAIYLRRRAVLTENNMLQVSVWVLIIFTSYFWADHQMNQDRLETAACGTVTEIMEKNNATAKCVKVTITEKVTDNFSKGRATLDNGRELTIAIKEKDDGSSFYVTIPPQF